MTLVPPETPDREGLTGADLDQIVREYSGREEAAKSPVVLGLLSQARQEPVARIDEVRRKGDSLEGKFGAVDPRADYLYGRGAFPKTSVRVKRSPDGVSLDSVGLIHRKDTAAAASINETPSLEELMQKHTGTEEHFFGEPPMRRPDFSHGYIEIIFDAGKRAAEDAISHLKERGGWCERFDRQGLPLVFAEVAGTPSFKPFVCFVESLVDRFDPMGELLYECARYLSRERKITFADALMEVANPHLGPYIVGSPNADPHGGAWNAPISLEQRQMERRDSLRAIKNHVLPAEIVDLAWRRAESKGSPYKQALLEVTAEHPEIMEDFQAAERRGGDVT
jgi:hypothetical protein